MLRRDRCIGMQRIAPTIQRPQPQIRVLISNQREARAGIPQHQRHVAMARGRIGTGADLESVTSGIPDQPVHDIDQGLAGQGFGDDADARAVGHHGSL
jgi:hypothetical protein